MRSKPAKTDGLHQLASYSGHFEKLFVQIIKMACKVSKKFNVSLKTGVLQQHKWSLYYKYAINKNIQESKNSYYQVSLGKELTVK